MDDAVLQDVKKLLGISPDTDVFDADVRMHINTILMILDQLGVSLKKKFLETGEELWSDLVDNAEIAAQLKTYIYLRVRLLFDPPSTSFVIDAIQKNIGEIEWRLNLQYDKFEQEVPHDG